MLNTVLTVKLSVSVEAVLIKWTSCTTDTFGEYQSRYMITGTERAVVKKTNTISRH